MKKDQTVELWLRKEMPFLSGKLTVLEAGMKLSLISPFRAGRSTCVGGLGGRSGTAGTESLPGRKHRACQLSLDVCPHPSSCPTLLHSTLVSCPSSSFTG